MSLLLLASLGISAIIALYTLLYGYSVYRTGNKLGGYGVAFLAILTLGLPVYYLFFR